MKKNVNQDNYPPPRSSSWSSSFSHPRSISLSIPQPLTPKRSRYDHVFSGSPKSKNTNTNVAEIETKLLTNDNNKEIVSNIPNANETQKYVLESGWVFFPDSNNHHLNSHRHVTLSKKDLTGTIQNHSTHFKLLYKYSKKIRQIICTCHINKLSAFKQLRDQLNCSIAFSSTQNQCWIITVLNTFKHDYSRTVYNSTEKIQPDLCQYSFRVQSHLPPNTNNNTTHCRKKKQCTQIFMNKLTYKPPYNPKRNKSYFFTIHIFCIVLFLRLIFTYVIT